MQLCEDLGSTNLSLLRVMHDTGKVTSKCPIAGIYALESTTQDSDSCTLARTEDPRILR
jgi:hypothetical protein